MPEAGGHLAIDRSTRSDARNEHRSENTAEEPDGVYIHPTPSEHIHYRRIIRHSKKNRTNE